MTDVMDRVRKCKACGKDKPPPRDTRVALLCAECEATSLCRHFGFNRGKPICAVGCEAVALSPRPCQWSRDIPHVACEHFQAVGLEACRAADAERLKQRHITQAILALTALIKLSHRGTDWSGELECPVCHKRIQAAHSSGNGHTTGSCETEGCVAWIE